MIHCFVLSIMLFSRSDPYSGVIVKVSAPNRIEVMIDGRERTVRIAATDFWEKREYYSHSMKGVRRALSPGDRVEIYYDRSKPGIPAVSIWKNGIDINRYLVKTGYLYFMPEIWYFQAYTLEEDYARNNLLGVWKLMSEDKSIVCKCTGADE